MAFHISVKEAARYPGLRARLGAAPAPKATPAKARAATTASVEWDQAREVGSARHWVLDLLDTELINANDRGHWTR